MRDGINIETIDTFVITRWRHEVHTAHYTNTRRALRFDLQFRIITAQKY